MNVITQAIVLASIQTEIPKPGAPEQPPGFEGVGELLGWLKWVLLAVLIAALMIAGVQMAWRGGRHGDGSEHAGKVGMVLGGTIIVSAAGSLIGFLA